ncbi:MAG TPA: L-threonylcarbamoyladenylate synthase [Lysobacter sp.]|nr:L-threonylcarbamoyladenylate synthase [Lysobacter sp.]
MGSSFDDAVDAAVAALRRGEAIGLPTETVYGLAADAENPAAVRRVFALKGRPADHPLIVHLPGADAVDGWARTVPAAARRLMQAFWPGPLTLILPRGPRASDVVTGGQDTVGLRVPAHPLAQTVLQRLGGGLAAPSANRFGRTSPTTAQHVRDEFGDAVPVVLDGGECDVGIESTIVDCSGERVRVLRPGMITVAALEAVLGEAVESTARADSPRVPGALAAHYAPRTPMRLLPRDALDHTWRSQPDPGAVRVLAVAALPASAQGIALPDDARGYAHGLYAALRALDAAGAALLLVERPPEGGEWAAVHDRLGRAAVGAAAPPGPV